MREEEEEEKRNVERLKLKEVGNERRSVDKIEDEIRKCEKKRNKNKKNKVNESKEESNT